MKEQHELDRLLKDKFDAREFEPKEADWEEAAGLIAAAEASGKRTLGLWWRWLFLDSAIAFTMVAGIFLSSTQTKTQTSTQTISQVQTLPQIQAQISSSNHSEAKIQEVSSHNSSKQAITANNLVPKTENPSSSNSSHIAQKEDQAVSFNQIRGSHSVSNLTSSAQNQANTKNVTRDKLENVLPSNIQAIDSLAYLSFTLHTAGASPDERLLPSSQQAEKIKKHSIGLVVGTQSSVGFDATEGQKLSHWPTFGLAYRFGINSRLRLQSGLMLENRGALSLNKDFISTQFGFGRNEQTVSLQPQSAHYLAIPLQLGYRFQKRHSLTLGLNAGYLLNVRSALQTQTIDPFGTLTSTTEKAWNYRQGYQKIDAGILLGYDFQFRPKMGVMLEVYQGLKDISDDVFWEVTRVDKQRQVRLKVYWNL